MGNGEWGMETAEWRKVVVPELPSQSPEPRARYNPTMGHLEHRKKSPAHVRCFVLTISDTRTESTDTGGRAVADLLESADHELVGRRIVPDDQEQVRSVLDSLLARDDVQAVITTGGTGISSRDGTFEAVSTLLEKRLDGFGELFRMLSFEEIGAAAMLSRACAGTARGRIILSLPGSEHAVRLAMNRLILPELGHLVREATR